MSSPRLRATATAAAIAAALGRPASRVDIDRRWAEADLGAAEGRTIVELEASDPELAARLARGEADIDWPGGETASSLAARVTSAWRDVLAAGRPVVVVSHSGPIRLALAIAGGVAPEAIDFPAPGESRRVEVS